MTHHVINITTYVHYTNPLPSATTRPHTMPLLFTHVGNHGEINPLLPTLGVHFPSPMHAKYHQYSSYPCIITYY